MTTQKDYDVAQNDMQHVVERAIRSAVDVLVSARKFDPDSKQASKAFYKEIALEANMLDSGDSDKYSVYYSLIQIAANCLAWATSIGQYQDGDTLPYTVAQFIRSVKAAGVEPIIETSTRSRGGELLSTLTLRLYQLPADQAQDVLGEVLDIRRRGGRS